MSQGFAIILSWPETKCRKAGGWYDGLMEILSISKNGYYKVGHSAVVLVNPNSGTCKYFDFGRYISPNGYGRVRDSESDQELIIGTKLKINSSGKPNNLEDLLLEIASNPGCHGEGKLNYALKKVNYDKALNYAKSIQQKGYLKYGPFVVRGTNCARFVRNTIAAGLPLSGSKIRLFLTPTFTPTPQFLVTIFKTPPVSAEQIKTNYRRNNKINPSFFDKRLNGIGSSSFFKIESTGLEGIYSILRISENGIFESFDFYRTDASVDLSSDYKIVYPSHSKVVTIDINGVNVRMQRLSDHPIKTQIRFELNDKVAHHKSYVLTQGHAS